MNTYITGATIKKLREKSGMTQSDLAQKLGVSDKTVSKWETGKGYPDITLIEDISGVLGVSVVELMSGEVVNNQNRGFNMKRVSFYVCPVCGNVIFSAGEAVVCCHGITLPPVNFEENDNKHKINIEIVEDEYYVTLSHEMSKKHYISFLAAVGDNGVSVVKLYPEGEAQARFKISRTYEIYAYCNRHGLFKIKPSNSDYSAEAKERYGNTDAYKESLKKAQNRSDASNKAVADGLMWIFAKFGAVKQEAPDGEKAQALVEELKNYITNNYYNCTCEILKGLGNMYVSDPRFAANIDSAGGEGTAEFVARAIAQYKE